MKSLADDTHKYVSSVSSAEINKAISKNKFISFNITKEGLDRVSVCSAKFDDSDISAMLQASAIKFKQYSAAIKIIEKVLNTKDPIEKQIVNIKKICQEVLSKGEIPDVGISTLLL